MGLLKIPKRERVARFFQDVGGFHNVEIFNVLASKDIGDSQPANFS